MPGFRTRGRNALQHLPVKERPFHASPVVERREKALGAAEGVLIGGHNATVLGLVVREFQSKQWPFRSTFHFMWYPTLKLANSQEVDLSTSVVTRALDSTRDASCFHFFRPAPPPPEIPAALGTSCYLIKVSHSFASARPLLSIGRTRRRRIQPRSTQGLTSFPQEYPSSPFRQCLAGLVLFCCLKNSVQNQNRSTSTVTRPHRSSTLRTTRPSDVRQRIETTGVGLSARPIFHLCPDHRRQIRTRAGLSR